MTPPLLDVAGLTVHYGSRLALDDVGFTVPAGTVCGLAGTNGAGKSTLMKAILGLVPPTSGQVRIAGSPVRDALREARVAYVGQSSETDADFPIRVDDVVMTGRYGRQGWLRRRSAADRAAVADALDQVGLADLAHRQIGELSGGQRKRMFVARAIAQEADLLLLDEPFAGVDRYSEALIVERLRALAADGRGILVSTHDLASMTSFTDSVVLLARRLIAHSPPDDALSPDSLAAAFGLPAGDRRSRDER
ncbi:metal ABC transporter ATP-binding protein [Gordonia zhaorongruii]|uniref:metal ABC transporter ATP-binding protein n=1 Tax=Gordonia zhaorongruii TaxID=2597659 RepID=UPI001050DA0A|nr:metal ABC transporter ATP-binding protein [Gordonia zhaorongruii]